MPTRMKRFYALLLLGVASSQAATNTFIVKNGQPRAEIVIVEKPLRSVRIAADDLLAFVQKSSGARLPIVTEPSGKAVKLFVGCSEHTDRLGVMADRGIAAFVALADGKVTQQQKSFALSELAAVAHKIKDFAQADQLTERIPVEAMKQTATMQNLLARRQAVQVLEQFGGEDITRWPFWAAGEAYAARGRAYAETGDKTKTEADFAAALTYNLNKTTRDQIAKSREGKRNR